MSSPVRTKTTVYKTTTTSYSNVDIAKESHAIEVENLTNINIALKTQLASYNDLVADVNAQSNMLAQNEQARVALQGELLAAQQRLQKQSVDNKAQHEKLSQEISSLKATIQKKEVAAFEKTKEHMNAINALNALHADRQKAYVVMIDEKKTAHSFELETIRKQHKVDITARDKSHEAALSALKADMQKRCAELQAQMQKRCAELQAMIDSRDVQLAAEKKDHSEKQLGAQRKYEEWQKTLNAKNFAQVMKLQTELSLLVKVNKAEKAEILAQKEKQRSDYELKINGLDAQIKQLTCDKLRLETKVSELQTSLARYTDIEKQLAMSRSSEEQMRLAKITLQEELNQASAYILQIQQEHYAAKQQSLELLRELQQMSLLITQHESHIAQLELDIANLKNYIIDLKSRIAVYIPAKNDVIDKRIAEYINNYPDRQKLKILFIRESEGVYQFGSKRIHVNVKNDKINIKVGGGFLSVDEFLDQYTPSELKVLERNDPVKRFSERVAVSKQLQKGVMIRDSSPDSPMKRSPTKKGSIAI